jgi:hypothetical protein
MKVTRDMYATTEQGRKVKIIYYEYTTVQEWIDHESEEWVCRHLNARYRDIHRKSIRGISNPECFLCEPTADTEVVLFACGWPLCLKHAKEWEAKEKADA